MDWTNHPEYDIAIREYRAAGKTAQQIADALFEDYRVAVTGDQVSGRLRRMPDPSAPKPPPAAREFAKAFSGRASFADLLDIIENEAQRVPAYELDRVIVPVASGTPESMNVVISDSHVGKLVQTDVVGDNWSYGVLAFADRANRLEDRILRLAELQMHNAPIDELNLWFLGDLIDGTDMRRGHPHRVDVQSAARQTMIASQILGGLIGRVAAAFPKVNAFFQYGNHGRIGEFGVNLPMDNWDYLVSLFIQEGLRDLRNVKVIAPTTKYGVYDLKGLRVYAAHGDMIRGAGGRTTLENHVRNQIALHRQTFDLALMGHFHTSQFLTSGPTKVFMNGAWDGGDDFEVNQLGKSNDPAQWAFGVSPTRGLTWQYEIQLAPKRQPTPAQEV